VIARTTSVAPSRIWPGASALWERIVRLGRRAPRRLRLAESLPLGERRFVAVVEFENSRFLLGGTSSSLVLLARLEPGHAISSDAKGAGGQQ
jgi:flagellar biogenesis protein FliO